MSMITVDDYTVAPNIPKARDMRVVGIFTDFDYGSLYRPFRFF